jgi:cytochrome c-type biogenesis protein CcmH/NrfF
MGRHAVAAATTLPPVPAWLVWLLPVPVATLAAAAWVAWSGRVRRPAQPLDSVADYARFRRALAQPVRDRRPTSRRR